MPNNINPFTAISVLDPGFVKIIDSALQESSKDATGGVILNFRDPTYSATNGGYHPVEIHVDSKGDVLSITDFAYFGVPPFVELGIELDFSFEHDHFRQFDSMYDLECGRGMLGLYLANFTAYYKSGVYQVEVTAL